jgi:hypothetical protein
MALDASVDAELLGSAKGEGSKGEKRKRFEVEDFNRPYVFLFLFLLERTNKFVLTSDVRVPRDELPLATLKLDSTKAVIDKTLIKEGKSVTSGYYKVRTTKRSTARPPLRRHNTDHHPALTQEAYSWADRTFINCDLRYYNLASLGKFDAILIDPPWRIKGNQLISNEKTMFNNSTYCRQRDSPGRISRLGLTSPLLRGRPGKWGLSYGTMSNDEIIDIDVGCLSDKGFIFLWVINSQIEFGFKCLQKWGYTYVDRVHTCYHPPSLSVLPCEL